MISKTDNIYTADLTEWKRLEEEKEYKTILSDPDLFWLSYCKARSFMPNDYIFSFDEVGSQLKFSADPGIYQELKKVIEKIRELFLQSIQSKTNASIGLRVTETTVCLEDYFDLVSSKLDIIGNHGESVCSLDESIFKPEIHQVFPKFAEFLGAEFREGSKIQRIYDELFLYEYDALETIEMKWNWQ